MGEGGRGPYHCSLVAAFLYSVIAIKVSKGPVYHFKSQQEQIQTYTQLMV